MIIKTIKDYIKSINDSMKELTHVFSLTMSGILLGIRVVLGYLTILVTPTVKIGFAFLATASGAILYGPFVGGIIGGLGDILSYIFNPVGGSYFPGFSINGILVGMIYGAFFYRKKVTVIRAIICELVIVIFIELLLSSLWLHIMFDNAFLVVLISRILKCVIMFPIDVVGIICLGKLLPKLKNKYNKY